MGSTRTLLFRVGERVYGCDIAAVREIVPFRPATRLPGAPPYVLGLINLRGILTTVLDLGGWLEPERSPAEGGSIVLVDHGARHVGLAVDEMLDVQGIVPEPLGDVASGRGGVLKGVGRMDETVVILLDVSTLVEQVLA
ncbi:MAG: chemotaxis protein CheW [Gemmatimonadaceae bacterium]|nr:chemotaxis protein CheW [Gemmatimonadaceae bacterium]